MPNSIMVNDFLLDELLLEKAFVVFAIIAIPYLLFRMVNQYILNNVDPTDDQLMETLIPEFSHLEKPSRFLGEETIQKFGSPDGEIDVAEK